MNIEVADRLVQLRKKHGFSQEELAQKLGLSRQAVSKWERAESSPDTDNLICLAKLYNISLDELLNTQDSLETIVEEQVAEPEEGLEVKLDGDDTLAGRLSGICTILVVISYFVMGAIWDLWHPGWIVFLMIPTLCSLIEAIVNKNPSEFAFPVLCAAVYLYIGCCYGLWHPGWIIFLLVPIYYLIFPDKEEKNKSES